MVIGIIGLVSLVFGGFLLFEWFLAEILPLWRGQTPTNSMDFRVFRNVGAELGVFGIGCCIGARRMLKQKATAHKNAA